MIGHSSFLQFRRNTRAQRVVRGPHSATWRRQPRPRLPRPGSAPILRRFMSSDPTSLYSRKNPFPAMHPVNRKLSGEGSGKDTRHHEISLAGSGLHYEVGDSLGLFATNDPALVAEIIAAHRRDRRGKRCPAPTASRRACARR